MAYEQNGHGGSVAGGGRGRIQSHHPHQQQIGRGGHGHARGQQGSRAVSHPQYSQRDSSGRVTTAAQLLERLLTEEDSAKRIAIASQFTLLVNNAPTGSELADPRNIEYLFRSEQGVIEALLSEVRMVTALKQSFTHAVAAIGLAFQSEPGPFYGYVFERLLSLNQIASGEHERELKMSWLVVLKEVLEASVVPYPSNPLWSHNMIAKILQDTQVFLDTMEGPEYLPKVLDILSIIYDRYSEPFKMAFKDLIAVLVGWHIDPSLPKNLSRIIRDSLRRFSKIWRDRARFGLDLMKNLFADMETELQAVKSTPNPRLSLKLHNLFRCHITVTQCLCHAFFSTVNPETTQAAEANQFILQEFCGLLAAQLEFLNTVSSSELRDKDWWLEGLELLKFLSQALQSRFIPLQLRTLDFILSSNGAKNTDEETESDVQARAKSVFLALEEVIEIWTPHYNSSLVDYLINPSSSLVGSLCLQCATKDVAVSEFRDGLLRVMGQIANNDQTSAILVNYEQILDAILFLTEEAKGRHKVRTLQNNSAAQTKWAFYTKCETKALETLLHLHLDVTYEAAAMFPDAFPTSSLVQLYFSILIPEENENPRLRGQQWWLKLEKRSLFDTFELCRRHSFFLLTLNETLVAKQCKIIQFYLKCESDLLERKLLLLTWLHGMVELLAEEQKSILSSIGACIEVVAQSLDAEPDAEIREFIGNLLYLFFSRVDYSQQFASNSVQMNKLYQVIVRRMHDPNHQVRAAFLAVVGILDDAFVAKHAALNYDPLSLPMGIVMSSPPLGNFSAKHFLSVFQNLFTTRSGSEEEIYSCLARLFRICNGSESILAALEELSLPVLRFWALWESARFCLESKLKTHLGGFQQTLDAFEALVVEATQLAHGQSKPLTQPIRAMIENIIDFLTVLETQVINATRGPFAYVASLSKATVQFLCDVSPQLSEFFWRQQSQLGLCCALVGTRDEFLGRYGMLSLRSLGEQFSSGNVSDSQQWMSSFDQSLVCSAIRFLRAESPANIRGLKNWVNSWQFPPSRDTQASNVGPIVLKKKVDNSAPEMHTSWLAGVYDLAKGSLETAGETLLSSLLSLPARDSSDLVGKFIFNEAVMVYALVNDLDGIKRWKESMDEHSNEVNYLQESVQNDLDKWISLCDSVVEEDKPIFQLSLALVPDFWRTFDSHSVNPASLLANVALENLELRLGAAVSCDNIAKFSSLFQLCNSDLVHSQSGLHSDRLLNLTIAKMVLAEAKPNIYRQSERQTLFLDLAKQLRKLKCFKAANRILNSAQLKCGLSDAMKYQLAKLEFMETGTLTSLQKLSSGNGTPEIRSRAAIYIARAGVSVIEPSEALFELARKLAPEQSKIWRVSGDYHFQRLSKVVQDLSSLDQKLSPEVGTSDIKLLAQDISVHFLREYGSCTTVCEESSPLSDIKEKLIQAWPSVDREAISNMLESANNLRKSAHQSVLSALNSYVKQLALGSENARKRKKHVMITTLRILELLSSYGNAFESEFSQAINDLPPHLWLSMIPQLFTRLNHPSRAVRSILSRLLLRLWTIDQSSIIFPTVVGIKSEKICPPYLPDAYRTLLAGTKKGSGNLVLEIETMIFEFCRITLLWEELWLNGLGIASSEIRGRFARVKTELHRSGNTGSLLTTFSNMSRAVMTPIVESLRRLSDRTVGGLPQTPHEQRFKAKYGDTIERALSGMENPKDLEAAKKSWLTFEGLRDALSKDLHRSKVYALSDVSPFLASTSDSKVTIPGYNHSVTIAAFGKRVSLIPTKTKPKRFEFKGSNGRIYSYLFKGHEDLHLDQRIQQFISNFNDLLCFDTLTSRLPLAARTYAVIPFGDRFGMLQWVEKATPLFALYKRSLERTATAVSHSSKRETEKAPKGHTLRPQEIYASKALVVLKRHGLSKTTARHRWPPKVLRDILLEMYSETPSDLIALELRMSSATPRIWWQKTQSFSNSLAVNSMIGYIIGLGDRHLDNILVDSSTAEVVHIDYNVCFDKGEKLRIPETVPFRLTRNLVQALGVMTVDGAFRHSSELTMTALRNNSDVLITLLQAFVFDPLSDWGASLPDDYRKKILDFNADAELLQLRLADKADALKLSVKQLVNSAADVKKTVLSLPSHSVEKATSAGSSDEARKELERLFTLMESAKASYLANIEMLYSSSIIQSLREMALATPSVSYQLSTTSASMPDGIQRATEDIVASLSILQAEKLQVFQLLFEDITKFLTLINPKQLKYQCDYVTAAIAESMELVKGTTRKGLLEKPPFFTGQNERLRKTTYFTILEKTLAERRSNSVAFATRAHSLGLTDDQVLVRRLSEIHTPIAVRASSLRQTSADGVELASLKCALMETIVNVVEELRLMLKESPVDGLGPLGPLQVIRAFIIENLNWPAAKVLAGGADLLLYAAACLHSFNDIFSAAGVLIDNFSIVLSEIDALAEAAHTANVMQRRSVEETFRTIFSFCCEDSDATAVQLTANMLRKIVELQPDGSDPRSGQYRIHVTNMMDKLKLEKELISNTSPSAAQLLDYLFSLALKLENNAKSYLKIFDEANFAAVQSVIFVKRLTVWIQLLETCRTHYLQSEYHADDPTNEWLHVTDFRTLFMHSEEFANCLKVFEALTSWITREVCLKPGVKTLTRLIKGVSCTLPGSPLIKQSSSVQAAVKAIIGGLESEGSISRETVDFFAAGVKEELLIRSRLRLAKEINAETLRMESNLLIAESAVARYLYCHVNTLDRRSSLAEEMIQNIVRDLELTHQVQAGLVSALSSIGHLSEHLAASNVEGSNHLLLQLLQAPALEKDLEMTQLLVRTCKCILDFDELWRPQSGIRTKVAQISEFLNHGNKSGLNTASPEAIAAEIRRVGDFASMVFDDGKKSLRQLYPYVESANRRTLLIPEAILFKKTLKDFWTAWPTLEMEVVKLVEEIQKALSESQDVKDQLQKLEAKLLDAERFQNLVDSICNAKLITPSLALQDWRAMGSNQGESVGDLGDGFTGTEEAVEIDDQFAEPDEFTTADAEALMMAGRPPTIDESSDVGRDAETGESLSNSDQISGQDKQFFMDGAFSAARFAQEAIRKVKSKLEGRTGDNGSNVVSVEEQVDAVLSAAQSLDNLAKMYEGWMAWV